MSKMIYTSLAMSRNVNQSRLFQQTSINGLLSIAGYKQRTENQNMVMQGLLELLELDFINIYSDLALTSEIRLTNLKGSTQFFVKFNDEYMDNKVSVNRFADEEVDKELIKAGFTYTTVYIDDAVELFTFETKHSRANMKSFYLMAVSRALIGDKGDKYSTEKIDSITKYANINEKTALSYISALFGSELLFKLTLRENTKTGEIRDHNVYSRWCEKDNIIGQIETNDWFMNKTLFKIGDRKLSEADRNYIKNRSRKFYGLSEIY